MADSVILKNGITINGGGGEILNALIGDLFDQDKISANLDEGLMTKLGLVKTIPLSREETFDIMVWSTTLDELGESENLPEIDLSKWKGKGFEMKKFGGKYKISKDFIKWVETSKSIENADSSVKAEWSRIARNIKGLDRSKVKTKNKLFAEILTKSRRSDSAYGPGSLTPYGQPLLSTAHPYLNGTKTFSNYIGNKPLSATNDTAINTSIGYILDALSALKNDCRLQNGDYIMMPTNYELIVPRALETTARQILNTWSKSSPTANNEGKMNVFSFEGSTIELVVDHTIGSYDKNGNIIGGTDMWFLYNREGAMEAQALRYIELYPAEIEVYKNHDNKDNYISVDMQCTVDHYGAECFIVGACVPDINGSKA